MKKIATALSVAVLMGAGSYAMAQDAGVGVGVDAGAGVGVEAPGVDVNVGGDANASVDATTDNSYDSLTSTLSGSAAVDLSGVTDEASVNIVLLSSLSGDAAAFDESMSANTEGMTTLHGTVSGNAAITAKLEAEGYSADDVVAVKSNADGSVTVYVDDRG